MQGFVDAVKPILVFFDILFFFGFVYSLFKGWRYRASLSLKRGAREAPTLRRTVLQEGWQEVQRKFALGTPEAMKVAIIEADRFVDNLLQSAGYKGEHMADRLEKIIPDEVASVNRLWEAHRFRNELVHTPDFVFSQEDGRKTMDNYEAFLKEVKVLEEIPTP